MVESSLSKLEHEVRNAILGVKADLVRISQILKNLEEQIKRIERGLHEYIQAQRKNKTIRGSSP